MLIRGGLRGAGSKIVLCNSLRERRVRKKKPKRGSAAAAKHAQSTKATSKQKEKSAVQKRVLSGSVVSARKQQERSKREQKGKVTTCNCPCSRIFGAKHNNIVASGKSEGKKNEKKQKAEQQEKRMNLLRIPITCMYKRGQNGSGVEKSIGTAVN
jgi:hypothetical protein